jgi:hypothetical protein
VPQLQPGNTSEESRHMLNQMHCEKSPIVYLFNRSRRPTVLQTSAVLGSGADVQIGGGVRVGDAFQAIVGSKLIAM